VRRYLHYCTSERSPKRVPIWNENIQACTPNEFCNAFECKYSSCAITDGLVKVQHAVMRWAHIASCAVAVTPAPPPPRPPPARNADTGPPTRRTQPPIRPHRSCCFVCHLQLGEASKEERKHHSRCMQALDDEGNQACKCICSPDSRHVGEL
jgi:hypothetical protein